jgi:hypothetical protein
VVAGIHWSRVATDWKSIWNRTACLAFRSSRRAYERSLVKLTAVCGLCRLCRLAGEAASMSENHTVRMYIVCRPHQVPLYQLNHAEADVCGIFQLLLAPRYWCVLRSRRVSWLQNGSLPATVFCLLLLLLLLQLSCHSAAVLTPIETVVTRWQQSLHQYRQLSLGDSSPYTSTYSCHSVAAVLTPVHTVVTRWQQSLYQYIQLSLGGSSPYTDKDKTDNSKYT